MGPDPTGVFRRYQVVILQEKIAGQMGAEPLREKRFIPFPSNHPIRGEIILFT